MTGPSIAVAVLTYRRPVLLARCLESLSRQRPRTPEFALFVVDNDDQPTAQSVVEAFRRSADFDVHYVHESRPGISSARNRAVRVTRGFGLLAFLDDDETAEPGWLSELVGGLQEFDADVVQGTVRPELEPGGPVWAESSRVFERPPLQRGARLRTAAAGNVLLRTNALPNGDDVFDEGFGESGGEDTELFCRLQQQGRTIVAIPEAIAFEFVPLHRQTLMWLVRRAARSGAVWVAVQRSVVRAPNWRLDRLLAALRDISLGFATAIGGGGNPRVAIPGIVRCAQGVGTLAGLLHLSVYEYRRNRGTVIV